MARIVIASQSEDSRTKLFRLLTSSGFKVFRSCASGSELRRALSESEDCVAVIVGSLPDCKPDFARCQRLEIYDAEEKVFR